MAVLWVYKRRKELNYQQRFVEVPDALVPKLIAEGAAAEVYDWQLEPEPEQPGDAELATQPAPAVEAEPPKAEEETEDNTGDELVRRPRGRPRKGT